MVPGDATLIVEMARYAPVRTAIYSIGPPLWGLVQLVNAYLHGGALLYVGVFALVLTAFSILVTRYHAATYRRTRLYERLATGR